MFVTGVKIESVRANPKAKRVATSFSTANRPTLENKPFLIKKYKKNMPVPLFEEPLKFSHILAYFMYS